MVETTMMLMGEKQTSNADQANHPHGTTPASHHHPHGLLAADHHRPSEPHFHHHIDSTMPVISSSSGDTEPCTCAGCGGKIIDRYYLLAVEKPWHVNCLKCADCHLSLDSELTCFAKDGNIYCKEDYYRRFAIKRCARCQNAIAANELVMRAKEYVYHINCFTCASCNKPLTTGDYFGMKDNMIYCRNHYELVLQGEFGPPDSMAASLPGQQGQLPFYNGVGTTQKGRPRKRKSPMPDQDFTGLGMENLSLPPDGYQHGQPPRQKRVRTSFKHHQLRTMKSYFALNHNPDAKDLKQLAQKTGLSKRVLQVWFQNARAKYRRNLLKQQGGESPRDSKGELSCKTSDSLDADLDLSHDGSRSPALSDVSSSPSLSDLQNSSMEHGMDCESLSGNVAQSSGHLATHHHHHHHLEPNNNDSHTLTELFTNSITSMN